MLDSKALVEKYYSAFNRGDHNGMLDCLAEDIAHHVNEGGRRDGKALFAAFLKHMDRCYREQLKDVTVMVTQDGKRASAEFIVHGTYIADDEGLPVARGQTYVLPAGAFFDIRDGRIARVTTYYNLRQWMAQVSA